MKLSGIINSAQPVYKFIVIHLLIFMSVVFAQNCLSNHLLFPGL